MRLDRIGHPNRRQKYALVKLRKLDECTGPGAAGYGRRAQIGEAIALLEQCGIIDYGETPETEFFAIRLKDKYAGGALVTYATHASADGEVDYARDVMDMAARAGSNSPYCRKPD